MILGLGTTKADGFMFQSKTGIAVSSEVMAILSIFTSLPDFKKRLSAYGEMMTVILISPTPSE